MIIYAKLVPKIIKIYYDNSSGMCTNGEKL